MQPSPKKIPPRRMKASQRDRGTLKIAAHHESPSRDPIVYAHAAAKAQLSRISLATRSKNLTHSAISGSEFSQLYSYSMENTALRPWR